MSNEDEQQGLYRKYYVKRIGDTGKHDDCDYFVLDLSHDKFAMVALTAYVDACCEEFPELAKDLRQRIATAAHLDKLIGDFLDQPEPL